MKNIWKRVKRFVKNIRLSADEKLRSLGHKRHTEHKSPVNTYCGPQTLDLKTSTCTYSGPQLYVHEVPTSNRSGPPCEPPPPLPATTTNQNQPNQSCDRQPHSQSTELHPLPVSQPITSPELEEAPPLYPKPNFSQMAERKIQRQNRKEESRNSNSHLRDEKSGSKRRSKSEGPHGRRRMRNSMHETSTKPQYQKRTSNGRYSMFVEPLSDNEGGVISSGSDSANSDEMDKQKWTKNPLAVRKLRKGKISKTDKRKSLHNVENGCNRDAHSNDRSSRNSYQPTPGRELFIYPENNSSSQANTKSKYQRMEENRKKRIDMLVTSDEECSPQLRINRLRQRAMLSSKMQAENSAFDDLMRDVQHPGNGYTGNDPRAINRLSQYDDNVLSKYDENYNVDNLNGKYHDEYTKKPSVKNTKLPNILPEFLPENQPHPVSRGQTSTGHHHGNRNDNIPKTNVVVQHQNGNHGNVQIQPTRVKLSSESPKLRSFNEVRANQPTPLKKAVEKIELTPRSPNSSTDDSLDELIESNIQYLESEIESGKLKRQSGNFTNYTPEQNVQRRVLREPLRQNVSNVPIRDDIRTRLQGPVNYVSNHTIDTTSHNKGQRLNIQRSNNNATQNTTNNYTNNVGNNRQNIRQVSDQRNIPISGSATYSPHMQRRTVEHNDDISKSDSQLNALETRFFPMQPYQNAEKNVAPYPVLNKQTGNIMYVQPEYETHNQQYMEPLSLSMPSVDNTGMFSDVEYEIQVSDRIKKWEKKLTPGELEEQRKVLNTIREYESYSDSNQNEKSVPDTPIEIRRELRELLSPSDNSGVGRLSVNLTRSTSSISDSKMYDPSSLTYFEPKVVSSETNLHRIFRVVQEPKSQNVPSTKMPSANRENANTVTVQHRKKRQTGADTRQSRDTYSNNNNQHANSMSNVTLSESEIGSNMQQSWPPLLVDSDSGIRKSWRMSRYEDEINELKEIVSDNFRDLRKKFDSDMSETDTRRDSSPVRIIQQIVPQQTTQIVPLQQTQQFIPQHTPKYVPQQPQHFVPQQTPKYVPQQTWQFVPEQTQTPQVAIQQKTEKSVPVTLNIQPVTPQKSRSPVTVRRKLSDQQQTPPVSPSCPPLTPKIDKKQTQFRNIPVSSAQVQDRKLGPDVWSPNMESSKGLISMERVKARTLQTIPFSEDPVWKEIEGLGKNPELIDRPEELSKGVNFDDIDELLKLATSGTKRVNYSNRSKSNAGLENMMTTSMSQVNMSDMQRLDLPQERQRKLSDSSIMSSKHSFTPPTIKPLKLGQPSRVDQKSSTSALDDVLEDIRATLQKKPLSPQLLKNLDTSESNSSPSVSNQSPFTKSTKSFVFPKADKIETKKDFPLTIQPVKVSTTTPGYDNETSSWQQNQSNVQPQVAKQIAEVPYMDPEFTVLPYIINGNYHLDPSLLSEKLQKTGLVNELSNEPSAFQKACDKINMDLPANHRALTSSSNPISANQKSTIQNQNNQSKGFATDLDKSVDELKHLASEVEHKLSQIKSKIVSADEERLDSILLALRKFAPMTEQKFFNVKFMPNYETEQANKSKLEEALVELEKMYESLNLEDDSMMDQASRREDNINFQKTVQSSINPTVTNRNGPSDKRGSNTSFDGKVLRRSQIDEIERQTQNEFEDITKSFQVLLDEVTKQCLNVASGSTKYSSVAPTLFISPSSSLCSSRPPVDEIRQEPPRTQLKYDNQSQRAVQDSYNTAIKELESVAMGTTGSMSIKPVQSSVYLNLDSKPANQKVNESLKNSTPTSRTLNIQIPGDNDKINTSSQNRSDISMATTSSQFVSMATEFQQPNAKTVMKETSSSDTNQEEVQKLFKSRKGDINSAKPQTRGGRFRKRGNLEHRKSMPSIMRTVETQTVETQTEPPPSVSEIKDKFDNIPKYTVPDAFKDGSPIPVKRKMSTGIARMIDLLSSSEDERGRESNLKHSHSAPDLMALLDNEKENRNRNVDKMSKSSVGVKNATPRLVKHRSEAKSRFRSLKDDVNLKQLDIRPTPGLTSAATEDGVQTPKSKPPVYPVWKYPGQGDTPSPKKTDKKQTFGFDKADGSQREVIQVFQSDEFVRRRTRSVGSEHDDTERPRSFHELVATFEQNPKRLEMVKMSGLRKCASEDSMFTDLVLQKIYYSESDLREDLGGGVKRSSSSSGLKLSLEMKVKC